jgi:hypothetical protein
VVEGGAGEAIDRRDVEELIDVLRDAVLLLRAVAQDLVGSRAEGAAEYAANDEFRRVMDEVSAATSSLTVPPGPGKERASASVQTRGRGRDVAHRREARPAELEAG